MSGVGDIKVRRVYLNNECPTQEDNTILEYKALQRDSDLASR